MSWLLPSNRSARVFLPAGESKTYFFAPFTQGSCRLSAAGASRSRVSCFSLANSFLRAASHSSRDTIFGFSVTLVDIFIPPYYLGSGRFLLLCSFCETASRPPPPEAAPATMSPMVAKQNGHIVHPLDGDSGPQSCFSKGDG